MRSAGNPASPKGDRVAAPIVGCTVLSSPESAIGPARVRDRNSRNGFVIAITLSVGKTAAAPRPVRQPDHSGRAPAEPDGFVVDKLHHRKASRRNACVHRVLSAASVMPSRARFRSRRDSRRVRLAHMSSVRLRVTRARCVLRSAIGRVRPIVRWQPPCSTGQERIPSMAFNCSLHLPAKSSYVVAAATTPCGS